MRVMVDVGSAFAVKLLPSSHLMRPRPANSPAVASLYRAALRASRTLPQDYLRQFYRIKTKDDVRAVLRTKDDSRRARKLKRVAAYVRTLQAAVGGDHRAFGRMLDLATGRSGKLWHEIVEPLRVSKEPPPLPRIAGVEDSRPPQYTPELVTLLTSAPSRSTKPLHRSNIKTPPTLPPRADPKHPDARLLGRLSARREVNIRWRYYRAEVRKIIPPLPDTVASVREEIYKLAGPAWTPPPLARRVREVMIARGEQVPNTLPEKQVPRFIRRRYQELLGRLPILEHAPTPKGGEGCYTVSLHPSAIIQGDRVRTNRLPEMSRADEAWLTMKPSK